MFAPGIFPWSAPSKLVVCTFVRASASTLATSFARFCRATAVPCPVMTSSSSLSASRSSETSTVLRSAVTSTTRRLKPMRRTLSCSAPSGATMR